MNRSSLYQEIQAQASSLMDGETDAVALMANLSALLYGALKDVNWVGFYLLKGDQLVLGPFQGKPACYRIPLNRGVCGAAAREERTVLVADVHQFENHIACDTASNSEIVVPVMLKGKLFAVLDVDSPRLARFNGDDQVGLEQIVGLLEDALTPQAV